MMEAKEMFLNPDELRALTNRIHHSAQIKALCSMGIEHRTRPDGSPVVLRQHIEQLMSTASDKKQRKMAEPNWGALNAART